MSTYYVRQDGNDSNDGSANDSGHAWATPHYANTQISAGDTVYVINVDDTFYSANLGITIAVQSYWNGVAHPTSGKYPRIKRTGYGNVVSLDANGIEFKKFELDPYGNAYGAQTLPGADNCIIERCVVDLLEGIAGLKGFGFRGNNGTIRFCTVIGTGLPGSLPNGVSVTGGSGTVSNSIFTPSLSVGLIVQYGGPLTSDYNVLYGTNIEYDDCSAGTHDWCVANGNEVDPELVNPIHEGDFSLQDTSPCIDEADPADDDGQQGAHWDRGAYEWLPPSVPAAINIQCEDLTNPVHISDTKPELSAEYDNPIISNVASAYQIQVIRDGGNFSSPLWDSGKTACSVAEGNRLEIEYWGTELSFNGIKYYQRWKFWDAGDNEGSWSDGSDNWTMLLVQSFEITKTLTEPLPDRVWILPVVNSLDNITIKAGSGSDPDPAITETRLVTITGQYLRIKITFNQTDILRKILIFKIFD